ncbi:SURF1 family protein [Falsirhodobacter algicola]|uniref:SURF1-like protein n=1 Tax=Falsirhodobacter algicola TaxID=2692330 RepID=A0A8J8MTG1_9RHOB|nr:SURF1 family protein [Falsirhodobacter algicola]QUS36096.1 SURF1 family protein [Falsirhodobacter algicola]
MASTETRPRSAGTLAVLGLLAAAGVVLLLALGVWQVQRLHWKTDLIARVDARVHARPVAAPPPSEWAGINRTDDEYRRVEVTGTFRNADAVLTQAVTDLGAGFWVMTPLETADGTYLINRGFVPAETRDDYARPEGEQTVTGLLRITEPDGGFLRSNDPEGGRWFSRDVAAIAAAKDLGPVAPFFIDAEDAGQGAPVGGLTVIAFRNHHLNYAITWFLLAAGLLAASIYVGVHEWRLRRG